MKRIAVIISALIFTAVLIMAMRDLEPAAFDLRPSVRANLAASGVDHPVTAVLLNYRGYDTLLEIAVLLLALLGILAVGRHPQNDTVSPVDPLLQMLARSAVPLMVLVAIYLLWAGAFRPGGAFQAGAVLAAAMVLLHLTGLMHGWRPPGARLRLGLAGGFLLFVAVAAVLLLDGGLLHYPPAQAGALILLIESGLTISLALILAGLFLFMSTGERNEGDGR